MSLFNTYHHRFPVPLLAIERFSELRQQHTDGSQILESVVIPVLVECCGVSKPTEQDVEYFLGRLEQIVQQSNSLPQSAPPNTGRTLGSSFADSLRGLDTSELILYMCGFDFHKAKYVYTQLDRDVAIKMLDTFIELKLQENHLLFESCLYGFGNRYESDRGPTEVVDVNLDDENDLKHLSQIFAIT